MGEQQGRNVDEELLNVDDEEKLRRNFKSVYYMMNAKPDSKTKIFTSDVCIELGDIEELNELITEKFKSHYNDAGFMINVDVSLENKKSMHFQSWQMFEQQKWVQNHAIDNILIKWEFNAELPGYCVPQKHTLIVKMSDGIKPEDLFKIMFSGGFDEIQEIDKDAYPVVASVDFIDSILGDELLEIVASWVKGLRTNNESSAFINILKKNKRKVAMCIEYFLTLALALCCVRIGTSYIEKLSIDYMGQIGKGAFVNLIYLVFIMALVFILAKNIFSTVAQSIFETLRDVSAMHTFSITKGDKKKRDEDLKKYKRLKNNVIYKTIGAVIFNIICALITNAITKVVL